MQLQVGILAYRLFEVLPGSRCIAALLPTWSFTTDVIPIVVVPRILWMSGLGKVNAKQYQVSSLPR